MERANISARGLATKLAGGPDATRDDVEAWRRYVLRWRALNGDRGMNLENAEAVAGILGTDPGRYLSPKFNPRTKLEQELARLRQREQEVIAQLARLPEP